MNVTKAQLFNLQPDGKEIDKFPVQFNLESLKISFANQIVPPKDDDPKDVKNGTSGTQHVGTGTTKLSVQLWFDVTGELPDGLATNNSQKGDVRELTRRVVALITPQADPKDSLKKVPPLVRFLWGSFLFEGIIESLEQSLEFFSAEGIPLRASISLSLSQQSIENKPAAKQPTMGSAPSGMPGMPGGGGLPGTSPMAQATLGASLQGMAAAVGKGGDWQGIALANNIENPRLLAPGQLVNLNVSVPRVNFRIG